MFTVGDNTYRNHKEYADSEKHQNVFNLHKSLKEIGEKRSNEDLLSAIRHVFEITKSIIEEKPKNYTSGDQLYIHRAFGRLKNVFLQFDQPTQLKVLVFQSQIKNEVRRTFSKKIQPKQEAEKGDVFYSARDLDENFHSAKEFKDAYLEAIELCSERAKNKTPLNFKDLTQLRALLNHDRSQNPKELEREIEAINARLQSLEHSKTAPIEICELLGQVCYDMQNYSDERVAQLLVNYILMWFSQDPVTIPEGKKNLEEMRGYFAQQIKKNAND